MTDFSRYMINLAMEETTPQRETPPIPTPFSPTAYCTALFDTLDIAIRDGHTVTRLGLDRMMDALFQQPEMGSALDDPAGAQAHIASRLHLCTPLFQSHWRYIILPAWEQHAEIRRACLASVQ